MAKTVLDVLKERLEEAKSSEVEFLTAGGAKDFAMYKETTGLVRGREPGLQYIADLSRNLVYEDD